MRTLSRSWRPHYAVDLHQPPHPAPPHHLRRLNAAEFIGNNRSITGWKRQAQKRQRRRRSECSHLVRALCVRKEIYHPSLSSARSQLYDVANGVYASFFCKTEKKTTKYNPVAQNPKPLSSCYARKLCMSTSVPSRPDNESLNVSFGPEILRLSCRISNTQTTHTHTRIYHTTHEHAWIFLASTHYPHIHTHTHTKISQKK